MKPNLAEHPDSSPTTFPKYASSKLDGIRGLTQDGTAQTRSLKPIPNPELRDILSQCQGLDGELGYGDPTDPLFYNQSYSAVMTKKGRTAEGIVFYVFDILDSLAPYTDRLAYLQDRLLPPFIKVLPQTLLHCQEDLDLYYANMLAQGYEGAVLRNPNAYYKEGRSTAASQDMLKFKPFLDSDAIVIDIYEAMTNNNPTFTNELGHTDRSTRAEGLVGNGMAGGLTVAMDGKIFNIGAGRTSHAERIEMFANRQNYIGELCTFRHLTIGAKDVPRHGRFMRWRSKLDT